MLRGREATGSYSGNRLRRRLQRRVLLDLPGFLGLGPIISGSDLIATLPRHIGETLAAQGGLAVHPCPVPVPHFDVKQHWHGRYHQDPGNRWLRALVAGLFMAGKPLRRAPRPAA